VGKFWRKVKTLPALPPLENFLRASVHTATRLLCLSTLVSSWSRRHSRSARSAMLCNDWQRRSKRVHDGLRQRLVRSSFYVDRGRLQLKSIPLQRRFRRNSRVSEYLLRVALFVWFFVCARHVCGLRYVQLHSASVSISALRSWLKHCSTFLTAAAVAAAALGQYIYHHVIWIRLVQHR